MKNYIRLIGFVKPYFGLLTSAVVFVSLSTLVGNVASIGLIIPFVTGIIAGKQIEVPAGINPKIVQIVGYLNSIEKLQLLYFVVSVLVISFFLKGIFTILHSYLINKVSLSVVRDVKNRLYEKLLHLSLDFYSHNKAGSLVSKITYDAGVIQNSISEGLNDLILQSIQAVILFVFLIGITVTFKIPVFLIISSLLIIPLIIYPTVRIGKRLRKISTMSQEKMADINAILFETFSGIRIVKAFSMEEYEAGKFHHENQSFLNIMLKSVKRMIVVSPLAEFISIFCAGLIVFLGGKAVVKEMLDPGAFFAFLACLLQMIRPFNRLSRVHNINQQALAAAKRIFHTLDTPASVAEIKNALDIEELREEIVFKNVYFRYETKNILEDINLRISKGEIIALVGPSGAGKTTLLNLLPRFYDPVQGEILFDGKDIKKAVLKSLRNQIGIVTQETILFNDTVKANISYGVVVNQEKVEQAAKTANAHDFITNLPFGYDTVIGDRGFKLSGGEKQRLAIARAVLKNPPVLILDEATSQLDTESELMVQEAINNLIKGRTVFVIAHRLSTIRNVNRIVVINEKKIVEEGTHEELINKSGLYRKLYEMQFREK